MPHQKIQQNRNSQQTLPFLGAHKINLFQAQQYLDEVTVVICVLDNGGNIEFINNIG